MSLFFTNCKERKHEESKTELHDENEHQEHMASNVKFQCPMDCEKGKTYEEKGSCPVCKMDLKEKDHEEEGSNKHSSKEGDSHEEGEKEDHDEESEEHR